MRRNNIVVLIGTVIDSHERVLDVDGEVMPFMELMVETGESCQDGRHRVLVSGRQATELHHFGQAAQSLPLQVVVLGWLHSRPGRSAVMADRVTVMVPQAIREMAVEAIRREKLMIGPDESRPPAQGARRTTGR